jgi:hypothetical protein
MLPLLAIFGRLLANIWSSLGYPVQTRDPMPRSMYGNHALKQTQFLFTFGLFTGPNVFFTGF